MPGRFFRLFDFTSYKSLDSNPIVRYPRFGLMLFFVAILGLLYFLKQEKIYLISGFGFVLLTTIMGITKKMVIPGFPERRPVDPIYVGKEARAKGFRSLFYYLLASIIICYINNTTNYGVIIPHYSFQDVALIAVSVIIPSIIFSRIFYNKNIIYNPRIQ